TDLLRRAHARAQTAVRVDGELVRRDDQGEGSGEVLRRARGVGRELRASTPRAWPRARGGEPARGLPRGVRARLARSGPSRRVRFTVSAGVASGGGRSRGYR